MPGFLGPVRKSESLAVSQQPPRALIAEPNGSISAGEVDRQTALVHRRSGLGCRRSAGARWLLVDVVARGPAVVAPGSDLPCRVAVATSAERQARCVGCGEEPSDVGCDAAVDRGRSAAVTDRDGLVRWDRSGDGCTRPGAAWGGGAAFTGRSRDAGTGFGAEFGDECGRFARCCHELLVAALVEGDPRFPRSAGLAPHRVGHLGVVPRVAPVAHRHLVRVVIPVDLPQAVVDAAMGVGVLVGEARAVAALRRSDSDRENEIVASEPCCSSDLGDMDGIERVRPRSHSRKTLTWRQDARHAVG